jgi:solute carrier family 32 (vesicular inhibitory amino acid transporter)
VEKSGWTDLECLVGLIVILDGLLKRTTPGSLIEPAATYLFPSNWLTLPLSFGLLMSPWGGHSIFPNVNHSTGYLYLIHTQDN